MPTFRFEFKNIPYKAAMVISRLKKRWTKAGVKTGAGIGAAGTAIGAGVGALRRMSRR